MSVRLAVEHCYMDVCECWLVMRLPRLPLTRGQRPRESQQRFAEQLPGSRVANWHLRAKAGCSPGMRFRSEVRQIGRPQRPRLQLRSRGLVSWSSFDVRHGEASRGQSHAQAWKTPRLAASLKAA